jgi:hypothetical protein
MSIWDSIAKQITDEEQVNVQVVSEHTAPEHAAVVAECWARHIRIQALVSDYLARSQPPKYSDVHIVQWSHAMNIDSVVMVYPDRRWVLWDGDREGRFVYLSSDSIIKLEEKGSIADRLSLPPVPSAQFRVGEERISKALYKDLQRQNLI